jgi:long-subunit fatty acid transport protein
MQILELALDTSTNKLFLGYEGGILEPGDNNDDTNTVYTSNIAAGNFNQEYDYESIGYNGKFSANIAFQYNETISLGLNLNSHFLEFSKNTFLIEENDNTDSTVNLVNFENQLFTKGEGFSLQLGTIVKLSDQLRVGLSYDSPTWLTLREETTQYLSTFNDAENNGFTVNPNIVNIYPEYNLKTPGKMTGSVAYILGKKGLISFDYTRKNYANMSFDTGDNQLDNSLSSDINNTFKVANTYKLGAELRYKNISFRGGYRLDESPYIDAKMAGDLNGFSLGIGYNFGYTKLDLAYEHTEQKRQQQFFESGTLDGASINNKNSIISLTLSMDL